MYFADDACGTLSAPLIPEFLAAREAAWPLSMWPVPLHQPLSGLPRAMRLYEAASQRAVYFAVCQGAARLKELLKFFVSKVGCTGPERLSRRMEELRDVEYGALQKAEGKWIRDPGWDMWFASKIASLPTWNSPHIRVGNDAIIVDLPPGMSDVDFDKAFDARFQAIALVHWAATATGQAYCAATNVNPGVAFRFTADTVGTDRKITSATELFPLNPHKPWHVCLVVDVISQVIVDHLATIHCQ